MAIRPWTAGAFVPEKQMGLVHLAEMGLRREIALTPTLCPPKSFVIGQGRKAMECIDGGHRSQTPRAGGDR